MPDESGPYVSRGGIKLAGALDAFGIDVSGLICADLGSHVGGFVDCLLRRGACRVYSVDTSYGTLAWALRKDGRVIVLERTNAMHVRLAEPVDLITIDAGWTRQGRLLPNARGQLRPGGRVVTLIKPHYEAPKELLLGGVLPDEQVGGVLDGVCGSMGSLGFRVLERCPSPIRGHGGNEEYFALLTPADSSNDSI
jgi:23S rRNA (cytidine1920-2'-O)/16S rRNA (cytidine1409-2'-O)-methyltransferase